MVMGHKHFKTKKAAQRYYGSVKGVKYIKRWVIVSKR